MEGVSQNQMWVGPFDIKRLESGKMSTVEAHIIHSASQSRNGAQPTVKMLLPCKITRDGCKPIMEKFFADCSRPPLLDGGVILVFGTAPTSAQSRFSVQSE